MSYIGQRPVVGRYIKLDQISSGFNGSNTGFSMTAGSQAVFPGTARNLLLSLGGVIQEPDTDFTISGSTLTFTTPPVANTTFFGVIYGDMQATGTPSDGTVLPASIASSGNFSFPQLTVTSSASLLGGAVFNENGADVDFRVEGDTEANLLFVDASADKVGIGTASPNYLLDVEAVSGDAQMRLSAVGTGSSDDTLLRLQIGGTSANNYIYFGDNDDSNVGQIRYSHGSNFMSVHTNASEALRIDSSGRVGIGTSTPQKPLNIFAAGTELIRLSQTVDASTQQEFGIGWAANNTHTHPRAQITVKEFDASDSRGSLLFYTRGTNQDVAPDERMRIDSSGRVGIGTTSPTEELTISSSTPAVKLEDTDQANSYVQFSAANGDLFLSANGASSQGQFILRSGNGGSFTERMRINTTGNLGIGTNAPDVRLDVARLGNSWTGQDPIVGTVAHFHNGNNVSSSPAYLTLGAGNASISGIAFGDSDDIDVGKIFYEHTSNVLRFDVNAAERMRIDSSGRLFIGTTSTSLGSGGVFGEINLRGGTEGAGIHIADNDANVHGGMFTSDSSLQMVIRTITNHPMILRTNNTERMRIDSSGNIAIGTTSTTMNGNGLKIFHTNFPSLQLQNNATGTGATVGAEFILSTGGALLISQRSSEAIIFKTANTERMRLGASGEVYIGTSNWPTGSFGKSASRVIMGNEGLLTIWNETNSAGGGGTLKLACKEGSDATRVGFVNLVGGTENTSDRASFFKIEVANSSGSGIESMRIDSSGKVGIATASPGERLDVNGTTKTGRLLVNTTAHHNSSRVNIVGHSTGSHTCFRCADANGNQLFKIRNDGAVEVDGSLSKGSGSFLIEHPLPSLAATKTLRHSFIEGPQCDNIYRGKVNLLSGTASINLDTVSKMTEGTFVVLNRDVQCFTSNETGWNAVKGSVTGNILTITCENNSSTDTISWMVVGERQDPNIKASRITDDDGYLLVEEDKIAALEAA